MVDISRVRVGWSGGGVTGPGVSTFYTSGSGSGLSLALSNYFNSISNLFPPIVSWEFPAAGEIVDSATGAFQGVWSGGPGTAVTGTAAAAPFSLGVGVRVVWTTGTVSNGRRVRGSTYLVPFAGQHFDNDGTIKTTIIADLSTKTGAFRTAAGAGFVVWTRPKGGSGGGTASITGHTIPDKVTWLTSRRT